MPVGHIVRVGPDHRAVEHALSLPRSFFHEDLNLTGAVVDATFAVSKPPLLDVLGGRGVPFVVDPESLRFASDAYRDVQRLAALPYAPEYPIGASTSADDLRRFVLGALELQHQAGTTAYLVPAVPLENHGDSLNLTRRRARAAAEIVGVDVERRPVVVSIAPATRVLDDPTPIARMLSDLPIDAVHVQPLRFRPTALSVGSLQRFCDYLFAIRSVGVSVSAGRVGAFGLVLLALGIDAFDSGLTTAEAFDLNNSIRAAKRRRHHKAEGERPDPGGRRRRYYLTQLKTTVMQPVMSVIDRPALRHRFTTSLPCCAAGFGSHLEHGREHCLFARTSEAAGLLGTTPKFRPVVLTQQLAEARDHAAVLSRALEKAKVAAPSFEHLERWRRLLLDRTMRAKAA